MKSDKYKLTCKNLLGGVPCAALEGYSVTVEWDYTGHTGQYTDGDGCVSRLSCAHPDTNKWSWEGWMSKKIEDECTCVLEGQRVTDNDNMPATLPGVACRCCKDGSFIQVESV